MGKRNDSVNKDKFGVVAKASAAAVAAVLANPVLAKDYTVSNVSELRAAIIEANASPEADTIHLNAGTFSLGIADLTGSEPDTAFPVTGDLTVEGDGMSNTLLRRDPGETGQFRLFHVELGAKLTLRNLELRGGSLDYDQANDVFGKSRRGGAVKNEGTLVIQSAKFAANSAALGGAIAGMPGSSLDISDSIFEANHTTKQWQGDGGAIFNDAGTAAIRRSTFSGNYTHYDSVITDTKSDGGAIENSVGFMEIVDSTFISNSSYCGGAVENAKGKLVIKNSTFQDNHGMLHAGAIYGSEPRNNGDDSDYGGGLIEIHNSTLTGNHAGDEGGGGVFVDAGIVTLTNNVISGNDSTMNGPDCGYNPRDVGDVAQYRQNNDYPGVILVSGNNLIGDLTACDVKALKGTQSLVIHGATAAALDALSDNGTPGNAHFPLKASSLAIDQGVDCNLTKDQLGNARVGGGCDLGAVEYQTDVSPVFVGDQFKKTIVGDYVIPDFYFQKTSSDSGSSDSSTPSVVKADAPAVVSSDAEGSGGGGALDILGLALVGVSFAARSRRS